ncbi:hypothetical protein [uncultured Corynebacterium sp.]|uniref:hypothetical protein n=1 Tax=uncultured Corynebacterium sp. TaxID=159447 RepID=UPI002592A37F|nr:hypothetical protein [uncultured Corynebacterium sp.]
MPKNWWRASLPGDLVLAGCVALSVVAMGLACLIYPASYVHSLFAFVILPLGTGLLPVLVWPRAEVAWAMMRTENARTARGCCCASGPWQPSHGGGPGNLLRHPRWGCPGADSTGDRHTALLARDGGGGTALILGGALAVPLHWRAKRALGRRVG